MAMMILSPLVNIVLSPFKGKAPALAENIDDVKSKVDKVDVQPISAPKLSKAKKVSKPKKVTSKPSNATNFKKSRAPKKSTKVILVKIKSEPMLRMRRCKVMPAARACLT